MTKAVCPALALCLFAVLSPRVVAQEWLTYRETTGQHVITTLIREEIIPGGSIMHSRMSDGDLHDVQLDSTTATVRYRVESPARKLAYTVTRQGNLLKVEGILGGRPLSKAITIDERPWYQSIERTIHDYVVSGATGSVVFWIVHPWEANAYLLQVRREAREPVDVNDKLEDSVRIRESPVGLFHFIWSALYWFRPTDARFLRYEAARGFPGTPKTVVELMSGG